MPYDDRWLTPDGSPGPIKAMLLWVPSGEEYEQIVRGALVPLTNPRKYEQYGAQTPEQTADAFQESLFLTMLWRTARVIGEIIPFAGTTTPNFCLFCNGQAVSEETYAELFAVIGYTFGNPGGGTFNLPDLRGRAIIGAGSGPSLTPRAVGDQGGEEAHLLTSAEMPSHTHSVHDHAVPAIGGLEGLPVSTPNVVSGATGSAGGDTAHNTMPPFLVCRYVIWTGVPS